MALIEINYVASPTSATVTRFIQDGCTIEEYLTDVEGLTSFKDINVEADGAVVGLDAEVEADMTISISQKKTASGRTTVV